MKNIEEMKGEIVRYLKTQNLRHKAHVLASDHNLEDFYLQQCKRYSLDPEKIKQKALACVSHGSPREGSIISKERIDCYAKMFDQKNQIKSE